jgi:hypothetical protein
MLDVKSSIYTMLSTDATLLTLVPVDQITATYPNKITITPMILFRETNQPATGYYDDAPQAGDSVITVDVYTQIGESTTEIIQRLDQLFENVLWHCEFSSDVPDPDANMNHRVLRYRRIMTAEDL